MPSELPIACSLSAADLRERLADLSAIGESSLLAADVNSSKATLSFRPGTREQLAAIVAAEAQCCPFLDMKLEDASDAVLLTVEAPGGAESVLQDLVAAFEPSRHAT